MRPCFARAQGHRAIPLLMEVDGAGTAVQWAMTYLGCVQGLATRPCVVFDIDGTILLHRRDGSSEAEPHVLSLVAACECAGLAVCCVTARADVGSRREEVRQLLAAHGVRPRHLYLMPPGSDYGAYKRRARDDLRRQGYQILLAVGDQFADLSLEADAADLPDDKTFVGQLGDELTSMGLKLPSEFA